MRKSISSLHHPRQDLTAVSPSSLSLSPSFASQKFLSRKRSEVAIPFFHSRTFSKRKSPTARGKVAPSRRITRRPGQQYQATIVALNRNRGTGALESEHDNFRETRETLFFCSFHFRRPSSRRLRVNHAAPAPCNEFVCRYRRRSRRIPTGTARETMKQVIFFSYKMTC